MSSKFFVICVLACLAQGLNAAVILNHNGNNINPQIFDNAVNEYQSTVQEYADIIDQFENVIIKTEAEGQDAEFGYYYNNIMNIFDEIPEAQLTEDTLSSPGIDPKVIRECILEQRPQFVGLVSRLRTRVSQARAKLGEIIYETFSPYVQKARDSFRILATEVAQLPGRIRECLARLDFLRALEVIRRTGEVVVSRTLEIRATVKEARARFSVVRENARILRQQIFNEARDGMRIIIENTKACVANGSSGAHNSNGIEKRMVDSPGSTGSDS